MSKRCEAGGHTRSMGVVMRRINASVCLVALVLVGCGVGTHAPNSGAGQAAAATAPTTTPKPGEIVKSAASAGLAWPVSLGLGHDPISALATDPSRAGVWFMCGDQTGAKACFWDARRHTLSSWTLEPAPVTHMDASVGMAVDSHGDLWVGANETLARLDPASGAVTLVVHPPPAGEPVRRRAERSPGHGPDHRSRGRHRDRDDVGGGPRSLQSGDSRVQHHPAAPDWMDTGTGFSPRWHGRGGHGQSDGAPVPGRHPHPHLA